MRRPLVLTAALCAFASIVGRPASAGSLLHSFDAVAISPDGRRVVALETDDNPNASSPPPATLVIRPVGGGPVQRLAPCAGAPDCEVASPVWSPDGRRVVFIVRNRTAHRNILYSVLPDGRDQRVLVSFAGQLEWPRFTPDGSSLAVLATANAHKEIGATSAGAPLVGEIGATPDEQRIAIVSDAGLHMVSPPDMFVYEYDWLPNASGFVGTAAHGNGDNNWWVARLYGFDARTGEARTLYTPPLQIATPRVSPDGRNVAFIAGLMSDFRSTGGAVYVVPATGGDAVDLTPGFPASATSLLWNGRSDRVTFTDLRGEREGIETVDLAGRVVTLVWSDSAHFDANDDADVSFARDGATAAIVRESFERAPEIAVGQAGAWHDLTHANVSMTPAGRARSIVWTSDAFKAQGWLIAPPAVDPTRHYPLIVEVHGGPSAAATPRYIGRGTNRDLLAHGYYLFFPNPRGSFGQGEAFTRANVKDFGGGDLRDILAGTTAVEKEAPIDEARLGLTGFSYGGYMTMWAVTQTHRFKAAVAGAGIANWQSYYGENGIDEWMLPFFGATVYDDPAVYAKSSPITFIKKVTTPTFVLVGERDVECPMPQSLEFWHALVTLGVPTSLVVYPGEGHRIRLPQHRRDITARTIAWFDKYLR
jgi:dipeptidyl aminopeptidase/acylaminoacyl peptidase